ncbi:hypothetical protein [Cereibacter azotoformans]|uniref:Uncharacterized protein n=1 Tax=Cereibacter azotoformans TaxID=43057 RepID=A0A2T5K721_9RHOB|nr:hypothetical protein [Cereibacter azotoformans]MBO4169548.1 hypothetical protein [Cereibacter azotoformans]PTR18225.1 hypothetical protein C8J28_109185 [Cereibacter azotoformans]
MHPRKTLRDELQAAVRAALPGVPLYVSRARQVNPGERRLAFVYVMAEKIERPRAAQNRGSGPLRRTILAEVAVACDGKDGAVVDDLDELCRSVEIAVSAIPGVELTGASVEIDGSGQTVCASCIITLIADKIDTLTA